MSRENNIRYFNFSFPKWYSSWVFCPGISQENVGSRTLWRKCGLPLSCNLVLLLQVHCFVQSVSWNSWTHPYSLGSKWDYFHIKCKWPDHSHEQILVTRWLQSNCSTEFNKNLLSSYYVLTSYIQRTVKPNPYA